MSKRIKKVQLCRNMVFEPAHAGAYGDQRTNFIATDQVRLSIDSELGGVLVEMPGTSFTVPWIAIDYVVWAQPEKKLPKEPPPAA